MEGRIEGCKQGKSKMMQHSEKEKYRITFGKTNIFTVFIPESN